MFSTKPTFTINITPTSGYNMSIREVEMIDVSELPSSLGREAELPSDMSMEEDTYDDMEEDTYDDMEEDMYDDL